jgi:hypothetical protein
MNPNKKDKRTNYPISLIALLFGCVIGYFITLDLKIITGITLCYLLGYCARIYDHRFFK